VPSRGVYAGEGTDIVVLENKLGMTDSSELASEEEGLSKKKSVELFENGCLDSLEAGTHAALAEIHRRLFDAIYDCAGRMRRVGSAKGNSLRAVDVSRGCAAEHRSQLSLRGVLRLPGVGPAYKR